MTNKKKSNCGRPAGRIKTAKIEISNWTGSKRWIYDIIA